MQFFSRAAVPLFVAAGLCLLAGCSNGAQGAFPSLLPRAAEQERVIAAPGDALAPGLSAEEKAAIAADLARAGSNFATVRADIAKAEAALARALKLAAGAPIGTESWSGAQMALSRFDDARAPLAEVSASLNAARITTDALPADNGERLAIEKLADDVQAETARTIAVAQTAEQALRR